VSGAIPPLPNKPLWGGAQLKHKDSFTFTFTIMTLRHIQTPLQWTLCV